MLATPCDRTNAVVYIELISLPEPCRPARVRRCCGRTLMYLDPSATCAEASRWAAKHLTPAELDYLASIYGPGSDYINDQRPVLSEVPDVLQPPSVVSPEALAG